MKKYLTILLLSLSTNSIAADLTMPVKGVYDGDTIYSELTCLPVPLKKVSIRIIGIDTPEIRSKCALEKQKALEAKEVLLEILGKQNHVLVKDIKWDKYGGRIDGKVYLRDGTNVGTEMISRGVARPYFGGFRKNWCN